jgi:hypothetical protein
MGCGGGSAAVPALDSQPAHGQLANIFQHGWRGHAGSMTIPVRKADCRWWGSATVRGYPIAATGVFHRAGVPDHHAGGNAGGCRDWCSFSTRTQAHRDPTNRHCSRSRALAGGSWSSTSLSLPRTPVTIANCRVRTPNAAASVSSTAALALPSTAGALTTTISAGPLGPSHRPPTAVRRAPGLTRTANRSVRTSAAERNHAGTRQAGDRSG